MDEQDPGSKIAERLMAQSGGATMDEIVAATGGPQYNVLKKLEGRGYKIRKVKEGRTTRYFAEPPAKCAYEATITSKGQVTIPKAIRHQLRVRGGGKLRFTVEKGDRITVTAAGSRLSDLFGVLGKPPRSATLEEMDEGIRRAAVARYLRTKK
jgi:AbrB family looped-hinge helix DNA binding protein